MLQIKSPFHFAVAICTSVVTAIVFWLVQLYPSFLMFCVLSGLFTSFLILLYFVQHEYKKDHTIALTLCTVFSTLLLFSVLDIPFFRWFFVIVVSLLFGLLFGINEHIEGLSFVKKPFRRFVMIVWVFDAYALFSCLFAVGVLFQSEWPVWLEFILIPASALVAGYISGEIWKMYVVGDKKAFLFWRVIIGFFVAELFWSLRLLPYGYLISGVILVWIWYVLQMLIRFHFQPQGILWKKQLPFLIGSAMVFILLAFFFVRWI
jgi:hypothetical protein